jgi:phosphocarrier protein FPr
METANRTNVALVLVSHSRALAEATARLARQMTGETVAIACAAGTGPDQSELGTDAAAIANAITAVDSPAGTVVLMDLGSALLSADLARELLDPEIADRVTLTAAPFVEGAVAAAARAGAGASRADVAHEARRALEPKAAHLGEATDAPAAPQPAAEAPDAEAEAVIRDPAGLHARPAARIVALAATFAATLTLANASRDGVAVPADSMVALAGLGARHGDTLRISARGPDAGRAVAAVADLITSFAGTEDAPPPVERGGDASRAIAVAPGIAIGPLVRLERPAPVVPLASADDLDAEIAQLTAAIALAEDTLAAGPGGDILAVQRALLRDPLIVGRARELIARERRNAAAAWQAAIADAAARYAALDDPILKAREADVRDAGLAVLQSLLGTEPAALPAGPPAVVVADDLAPSEAAAFDPARVLGVIDRQGGPTSHAAILLRAAGIPAVAGAAALVPAAGGEVAALDGATGEVWVDPDPDTAAGIRQRHAAVVAAQTAPAGGGRVRLQDGREVELWANVSGLADARAARAAGAVGIGLLRTEMLFLDRRDAPSEAEQAAALRDIFAVFAGHPIVVRTLDAGGDKPMPYLHAEREANPFLGVRGIRLMLERPELFERQLRAVLAAGLGHDIRLMLPMVAANEELRRARTHLDRAHADLHAAGIAHAWPVPLGIMVEVPAAALVAARLAEEAAFFSIGTNDLTQYALAAERGHPRLGAFADAAHPAVLRLIREVVEAGRAAGRPVSVCGEAAADPVVAGLLAGLGVNRLSVGAAALPAVWHALAGKSADRFEAAARAALAAESAADARAAPAAGTGLTASSQTP